MKRPAWLRRALRASRAARASADPIATVYLQMALPGGTRFLGRVDAAGCHPQSDDAPLPAHARVLLSDDRDVRFARAEPLSRREAAELAADLNPDVEHRLVFGPGRRVCYARALDELPASGEPAPLLLALEMMDLAARTDPVATLDALPRADRPLRPRLPPLPLPPLQPAGPDPVARVARRHAVLTLALGARERPDLVLIAGRDAEGALDPDSLQVWLRPQDPVAVLRRDYMERRHHADDDPGDGVPATDQLARAPVEPPPIHTQADLLAVASRVPTYPRTRAFFGRTTDQWAQLATVPVTLGLSVTLLVAGVEAVGRWRLQQRLDVAQARAATLQRDLQALALADPGALVRAASVDHRALVDAARAVWLPEARVRIDAHGETVWLTTVRPIPTASPAATAVADHLALAPPPGFQRGTVALSADHAAVTFTYVALAPRPAAARLLAR